MGRPECLVTGGYLRDRLLGRASSDLDLVVPGRPEQAEALARRLESLLGVRAHLLGVPPRAVWRLDGGGLKVELWSLAGASLEEDVRRRDFTVNALMWHLPSGPLVDLVGGLDDLAAGRLRALSRESLSRDPVRLLRGARFTAQLEGFSLDPPTAGLMRELAPRLRSAPRERIGHELGRLLEAGHPWTGIRWMLELAGIRWMLELDQLEPSAPAGSDPDLVWLERHGRAAEMLSRPSRHPVSSALRAGGQAARFALFVRAWRCPSAGGLGRYGWPRPARLGAWRAADLLDRALAVAHGSAADRREMIYRAGDSFPALVAAASAIDVAAGASPEPWRRWWRMWRRGGDGLVRPRPLLPAEEVARLAGVALGPDLGPHLRQLLRAQVRGEVRTARSARRMLAVSRKRPHAPE